MLGKVFYIQRSRSFKKSYVVGGKNLKVKNHRWTDAEDCLCATRFQKLAGLRLKPGQKAKAQLTLTIIKKGK